MGWQGYQSRKVWRAGVVCVCLWRALASASAQELRDVRLDPHPLRTQVGMVTRVLGNAVWIKMPGPIRSGAKAEFLAYSDGGDTLAVGQVQWVSPVAPYEAYVTGIKAVSARFPANPYDTFGATEVLSKQTVTRKPSPQSDPNGLSLAVGFFARLPLVAASGSKEAIDPLNAHIRALRALKTKTATEIANAVEQAMRVRSKTASAVLDEEESINYSEIASRLRRFRRLQIPDPITERLLRRIVALVEDSGTLGDAVSIDFLRAPQELFSLNQGGGIRR